MRGIKINIFKFFDCMLLPLYRFQAKANLWSQKSKIHRVFVVGGGESRRVFEEDFKSADGDVVAYTNYTPRENSTIKVDYWLASDPVIFYRWNAIKTLKYLNKLNPEIVIIPTRAMFTICGLMILIRFKFVLARYYGGKLWEKDNLKGNFDFSFSKEIYSFDTVAFEYGIPLASDLGAKEIIFAGVDLSYGYEEDSTDFRRNWRENIRQSINVFMSENLIKINARAYKGCENSILSLFAKK